MRIGRLGIAGRLFQLLTWRFTFFGGKEFHADFKNFGFTGACELKHPFDFR
jgi:hypothetical protein